MHIHFCSRKQELTASGERKSLQETSMQHIILPTAHIHLIYCNPEYLYFWKADALKVMQGLWFVCPDSNKTEHFRHASKKLNKGKLVAYCFQTFQAKQLPLGLLYGR